MKPCKSDQHRKCGPRHVAFIILAVAIAMAGLASIPVQAATRTVTSVGDHTADACDAECTLRDAIQAAAANDVIIFGPNAATGTIILTSGELVIDKNLTIVGPGARRMSVSGNFANRVFDVGGPGNLNVTVRISGVSIVNGNAGSHSGWLDDVKVGGGIHNSGTLTLTDCTIRGNSAGDQNAYQSLGAGIFNHVKATLTLRNCTIAFNLASSQGSEGGGIFNLGTVNMTNCTVSDNQLAVFGTYNEGYGAGIYNVRLGIGGVWGAATVNAVNCTIANNYMHLPADSTDTGQGGGIFKTHDAPVNLRNTIIAGNRSITEGPDVWGATKPFNSQGHNLIGITDGSTGWVASDQKGTAAAPLDARLANVNEFGGPANNGGPTDTYMLLPASPAIDKGDDSVLASPYNITTDQRGYPRKIGSFVDIGALEFDPPQSSVTLVVNTTAEHDDGICGSTDCTLVEALNTANAASNANVINFKPGLTGAITTTLTPNGLAVTQPVTINGPGARILAITGNDTGRIFGVASQSVVIAGLTLRNGRIAGSPGQELGSPGGIAQGGAIYNSGGLTLVACTLSNNRAQGGGGAFYGPGGTASGGAIYSTGTLSLQRCTLNANVAIGGPAINAANGGDGSGGAIYNAGGTLSLLNCTFSGNTANGGAGGDDLNGTSPSAGGNASGGAIFNNGTLSMASCTLTANSTSGGAGGFGNDFTRGATGATYGGGVYHAGGATPIRNSILAKNNAANGPDAYGAFASQGYNLIGKTNGSTGFGGSTSHDKTGTIAAPLDPKIDSTGLQDNGGPTNTITPLAGSPAIDAGNNSGAPSTDQRGLARIADGDGNGSSLTDIGALEVQRTYSINGHIATSTGAAIPGVGVAFSNGAVVFTDSAGNYTLNNLTNGNQTVKPSKSGYVFTPVSRTVTVSSNNVVGVNFIGSTGVSLSGRIINSAGIGIASVGVTISGSYSTVLTNGNGDYTIANVLPGSYTLTPGKTGYHFTPLTRSVNAGTSNITGLNFLGATGYNISGRITNSSGAAVSGVVLQRTGTTATVQTDSAGNYTFADVPNGTFTITPGKASTSFSPASRTVTMNSADINNQNFIAAPGYSISGRITRSDGTAIAGVTVTRTGGATVVTNSAGYFTFTSVGNGTYTLTPSMNGVAFTPMNKSVTVNGANVANQNFIGS